MFPLLVWKVIRIEMTVKCTWQGQISFERSLSRSYSSSVAWPSGLRRWFKAPVSSEAWVRIPPLPQKFFALQEGGGCGHPFSRRRNSGPSDCCPTAIATSGRCRSHSAKDSSWAVPPTCRQMAGEIHLGLWCDTPAVNLNHRSTGGSTVHSINMEIRATVASLTWDTQLIVCDITTLVEEGSSFVWIGILQSFSAPDLIGLCGLFIP